MIDNSATIFLPFIYQLGSVRRDMIVRGYSELSYSCCLTTRHLVVLKDNLLKFLHGLAKHTKNHTSYPPPANILTEKPLPEHKKNPDIIAFWNGKLPGLQGLSPICIYILSQKLRCVVQALKTPQIQFFIARCDRRSWTVPTKNTSGVRTTPYSEPSELGRVSAIEFC